MDTDIKIEHVPIAQLKPYEKPLRNHNRKQRRKLSSLLRRFGQVTPVIVDENFTIIDGHVVVDSLSELGQTQAAVVVVKGRDPVEIRALRIALNRIAEDTGWNRDNLRNEFRELLNLSFDLEFTGFDTVEIDMTLDLGPPSPAEIEEASAEEVEPAEEAFIVAKGDTWQLGHHLIACGDSQDPALLTRLMSGHKAAMVFTDPPYNVRIAGFVSGLGKTTHREFAMAAGEMSSDEFQNFLVTSLSNLQPALDDGAILFVFMDWRHMRNLLGAGDETNLELKNICVWTKSNAGMGSFYRSQHEFVAVFKHGNSAHQNNFELGQYGRSRSNVWSYRGVNTFGKDRMELLGAHPTVKPVALIADALRDVSRRGQIVIDPFLGSGSTLLAAEETGRVCVGIEIDPAYVEVAIRRWQKRTGRDALCTATGETFEAAGERRRRERVVAPDPAGSVEISVTADAAER